MNRDLASAYFQKPDEKSKGIPIAGPEEMEIIGPKPGILDTGLTNFNQKHYQTVPIINRRRLPEPIFPVSKSRIQERQPSNSVKTKVSNQVIDLVEEDEPVFTGSSSKNSQLKGTKKISKMMPNQMQEPSKRSRKKTHNKEQNGPIQTNLEFERKSEDFEIDHENSNIKSFKLRDIWVSTGHSDFQILNFASYELVIDGNTLILPMYNQTLYITGSNIYTFEDLIKIQAGCLDNYFCLYMELNNGHKYWFSSQDVLNLDEIKKMLDFVPLEEIHVNFFLQNLKESERPKRKSDHGFDKRFQDHLEKKRRKSEPPNLNTKGNDDYEPENQIITTGRFYETRKKINSKKLEDGEILIPYEPIPLPLTNNEIFTFKGAGKFAISIREHDRHRLNTGEFLNDTVIEFYLRYVVNELDVNSGHIDPIQIKIMNSHFYNRYASQSDTTRTTAETNYQAVKNWTKGEDIFSKQLVFVPINEHLHWYLAIIYNPGALLLENNLMEADEHDISIVETEEATQEVLFSNSQDLKGIPEPIFISSDVEEEFQSSPVIKKPDKTLDNETKPSSSLEIDKIFFEKVEGNSDSESVMVISEEVNINSPQAKKPKKGRKSTGKQSKALKQEAREIKNLNKDKDSCIVFLLDSLGNNHPKQAQILKQYLCDELMERKGIQKTIKDILSVNVGCKIPQQPNHCDCGVYLLSYVEKILHDPDKINYLLKRRDKKEEWFKSEDVQLKRVAIMSLMDKMKEEHDQVLKSQIKQGSENDDDLEIIA